MRPGVHAPWEAPPQREADTLQPEWLPPARATEKPTQPQRPSLAKNKYINKIVLFLKKEMWVASGLSTFKSNQVLGKEMATHSSPLAWRIPWTEEPAGLRSMGSQESDTTERLSHTLYSRVPNASQTQRVQTWSRHFLWNVSPSGICLAESWPTEVARLNSFRGIFQDPFPLIPNTATKLQFLLLSIFSLCPWLLLYFHCPGQILSTSCHKCNNQLTVLCDLSLILFGPNLHIPDRRDIWRVDITIFLSCFKSRVLSSNPFERWSVHNLTGFFLIYVFILGGGCAWF